MTPQCRATYSRAEEGMERHIRCTYIDGHVARHSWETLKMQDDVDREVEQISVAQELACDVLPPTLQKVLRAVEDGAYDDYLELILAVGHNRKRALRHVRGFVRSDN